MSHYAVILSARNGSERLQNKATLSYCVDGTPNLTQIIRRWRTSRREPSIIVATPATPENDAIARICGAMGVPCYRGERMDALTQMDAAMRLYAPSACVVARALGDNPLIDIPLADWRYDVLMETGADGIWYGGDHERITYAGTTDVWGRQAWDRIAAESVGEDREHPGNHYWKHIEKFSAVQFPLPPREYLANVRTELDTPEDLEMFKAVFGAWKTPDIMPTLWALGYLETHPDIARINSQVQIKTQSRPEYARGNAWVCEKCRSRVGGVVAGNLVVRCIRCGSVKKFYSNKPQARDAAIRR